MGDCFVLFSGIILGPVYGFFASGLGSALADVLFGYFAYAPATFIIKGLMSSLLGVVFCRLKKKICVLNLLLFGIISEILMVLGYFLYECFVLSYGIGAAASIPGNIFQGAFGVAVNILLCLAIENNAEIKNLLK